MSREVVMSRAVNAVVPYYGAKRQMAKAVVDALGPHQSYLEPFCGSLAVVLAKPKSRMEVVNDLNEALVNLVRVVAADDLAPQLSERLSRTAFCEALYQDSREACSAYFMDDPRPRCSLDWAYHYFVVSWMGRNGFVGSERELDTGFCKRFTASGGDPATRFRGAVASIPSWWERIRNLTVLSEDGIALCSRFEDADHAVVYADPPYVSKDAKYKHDFEPDDHRRLAEALRRFEKTRVVLSYYDDPLVDELYVRRGWKKTPVDVQKNLSAASGGGRAPEVLLTNFEVPLAG